MKIISTCEKEFVINCIAKNSRLDGRSLSEGRTLEITFGQEWGCCIVSLGNTKVLAQVSAEVTEPKTINPNEGALHINLEISAMSDPDLQNQSRMSDESVESQRLLERCVRDSKCIELESLCIVAGSKVWTIRVDVHALNDDGNLVEAASIAAISALAHFKRPNITVTGNEVTIHSLEDREPVPLNLYHMPLNINLALFNQGEQIVVDPTEIEEKVADGCYVIGMNAHQEFILIHRIGALLLSLDTIYKCEDIATRRSQEVTQIIRRVIDDDAYKRATKAPIGFGNMIRTGTILGAKHPIKKVDLHEIAKQGQGDKENCPETIDIDDAENDTSSSVQLLTTSPKISDTRIRVAKFLKEAESCIFEGGASKWKNLDRDDESSDEEEVSSKNETVKTPVKREAESSSEDEAVNVSADQIDVKPVSQRSWYSKDPFV